LFFGEICKVRLGLAQINPCVGDLEGNVRLMCDFYNKALAENVDLLVFPELSICGYPPEDLLHKKHFLSDNRDAVEKLAVQCPDITIIAGFPESRNGKCSNSAAILSKGRIQNIYRKSLLPNFGVFDEKRYFTPGKEPLVIDVKGVRSAVTICRDIWEVDWLSNLLCNSPKPDLIINLSASPFHYGKIEQRIKIIADCAGKLDAPVAYCNLVGGQDEIVFDGMSIIISTTGEVIAKANDFAEDLLIADIDIREKQCEIEPISNRPTVKKLTLEEEVYQALVLGTRDYFEKNGFARSLIGLSGGIDSSLVAVVAVDALSAQNVIGVTMPSRFNSPETISDAQKLAENLGIVFHSIPIAEVLEKFDSTLATVPGWDNNGIAFENLQARIRGTILMSLSNQFKALVLTTGNKSETAVGYSTLYGDTAGGFAVIKDVPKTLVYKLSRYVNEKAGREVIPEAVITRAPSAELRPDQRDSDSLPGYDMLDEILHGYVELDLSANTLIERGLPEADVKRIVRLVDINEYKRRQSPPGIKITPKAFGKDRRLPITNRYNG